MKKLYYIELNQNANKNLLDLLDGFDKDKEVLVKYEPISDKGLLIETKLKDLVVDSEGKIVNSDSSNDTGVELATDKQIGYIKKLNPDWEEPIVLTKKEASQLIGKFHKNK